MTDNAIIKALECCSSDEAMICEECPLNEECYNDELPLTELALDIINRQQEQLEAAANGHETLQKALAEKDREGERLTAEKDRLIETFGECQEEAVREFAEKLQIRCIEQDGCLWSSDIGAELKEMVGDKE